MRASGIATVMFTDLEASTDTTTRLGDDAAAALFAGHDRIVREQLAAHGGRNVRSTGDGFLVLFDSARSGIACALAIQRELAAGEDGVRVLHGVHRQLLRAVAVRRFSSPAPSATGARAPHPRRRPPARRARAEAVAEIDADLSRSAAAVPFATTATTDFFADRIGCQVHQPIYGISLGALCVRR